ncbi:MAG: GMC family oxidoreductase [Myxococcota bacterium]
MALEADVIVVGTGAGGSPVALTLARAGAKVLMFERGPRYSRKDFVHDEVRVARRNFFVPSVATDPHVVAVKGRPPERTHDGWVSSCVGGGTVHMSGFFYRFSPEDFRVRELLGPLDGATHADWPIDYQTMQPYYAQVMREIGVSGAEDEGPWAPRRDVPYPVPPVDTHPAAALIDRAASKLGLHAFATPRAIISRPFGGRQQCTYCHLCGGFGCEVGAKSSTLDTLIPAAEATGNCQVLPETMVTRIILGTDDRASGVAYRDATGIEQQARARVVVIACSAVESIRLMLLSTGPQDPQGLGNREGQLGQHLMFSTLSKAFGSFHSLRTRKERRCSRTTRLFWDVLSSTTTYLAATRRLCARRGL